MCTSITSGVAYCGFFNTKSDMEDAHVHLLSLPEDKDACFFAVYDGHGGMIRSCFQYYKKMSEL